MDYLTQYYKNRAEQLQEQINHIELQIQLQEGFFGDMRRGAGNFMTGLGRRIAGGAPVDDVVDPQIAIDANNRQTARSTHIRRTIDSLRPIFAFTKDRIPMAIAHHKANSENPLHYDSSEVPDIGMPTNKKEFKQAYKTNDSYNKSQAGRVVERGHNNILGHFASMIQRAAQSNLRRRDNDPTIVMDPVHTGHGYDVEDVAIYTMSDTARGRGSASHPDHEAYHRWQSRSQNAHHPTVEALFGPDSGTYHVGEDFEHLLPAGGGKSGIRAVNAANRERYRARMQQINSTMNPQDIPSQWRVAGRMG
jgi:hypothetical protein